MTNLVLAVVLGFLAAAGAVLIVAAVRGNPILPRPTPSGSEPAEEPREQLAWLVAGVVVALVVFSATGWPVAAVAGGVGVWVVHRWFHARPDASEQDRVEAVAVWTELIRDNMAAAAGIEQALIASAAHAPDAIAPEVRRFASRLENGTHDLLAALVALGDDLDMASADLVVVSLSNAVRLQARELGPLLSRLSVFIRADVRMRQKVDVGRARIRTSARIVIAVTAFTGVFLTVFSPNLVAAYDSFAGQVWLVVVFATFGGGAAMLRSFASIEVPGRFSARSAAQARVPGRQA